MFTGIIQDLGTVTRIRPTKAGKRLVVASKLAGIRPGDSVAVNGVCLTALDEKDLSFDVIPETLSKSNIGKLKNGSVVNLEPSLCAGDAIGGHFVQGHIDGTGTVRSFGRSKEIILRVGVAPALTAMMVPKGSIAIDGISLTLVDVGRDSFTVAIIPYTLEHTTLARAKSGTVVNIETDILGKYVLKGRGKLSKDFLGGAGFRPG